MEQQINEKVKNAVAGDKVALEEIILHIQDMIYNLALKMLWHPEEAKDATQEILIRTITNLSSFQHKSSFKTWVYRLASNTLINYKKQIQRERLSFDAYSASLKEGLSDTIHHTTNMAEQEMLIVEAKVGCSNAMLQCLDVENRLVYIIGEILELKSKEGASILELSPENFRKKLSRSRAKLHQFIHQNCGIVNAENRCRCHKKVDYGIRKKYIDPEHLLFAKRENTEALIANIEKIKKEVDLFRTNPSLASPEVLLAEVKRILFDATF